MGGERQAAYWRTIDMARRNEEMYHSGAHLKRDLGVKLTAYGRGAPPSDVKANYVGGPPPINWKSEFRENLHVGVHSKATHSLVGNPVQLVPLHKFNKMTSV